MLAVVEVPPAEDRDEMEEDVESEGPTDESYEPSSDEADIYEVDSREQLSTISTITVDPATTSQQLLTPRVTPRPLATVSGSTVPGPPLTILNELLKIDLDLQQQEKKRDAIHWKLLELQEALRNIERKIPEVEAAFQEAEAAVISSNTHRLTSIVGSGLSMELYNAYQDFCESLHPEFGLRDGFSITCDQHHNDSYFEYDPELHIFKDIFEEIVEMDNSAMDYTSCNFRCETSREPVSRYRPEELEDVVNFWPIRCPEPRSGLETTWGEQYVSPSNVPRSH
jgi:hypothetical protein